MTLQRIVCHPALSVPFFSLVFYVLAAIFGLKRFSAWGQVLELYAKQISPLDIFGSYHFYRYLTSYPGLAMENLAPGLGFSVFVTIFIFAATLFFQKVHFRLYGAYPSLFLSLLLLACFLFMNGRGAMAWAAWMVCIFLIIEGKALLQSAFWRLFLLPVVLATLLFASVSTGTFIVVLGGVGLLILRLLPRRIVIPGKFEVVPSLGAVAGVLVFILGAIFAAQYAVAGITKVINYYGSASKVIDHGILAPFATVPLQLQIASVGVVVLSLMLYVVAVGGRVHRMLWLIIGLSIVCGVFGYTTLTLAIPALLLTLPVIRFTRPARGRA